MLSALEAAGIRAGISGGWGVDALLGRQTRDHRDLDLAVPAEQVDEAIAALAGRGYAVAIDQRPARLELVAAERVVDIHPVVWALDGSGRQHGFADAVFDYPPGSMDAPGVIGGQPVRCATPALQISFHGGYAPTEHDRADMRLLAEAFDLEAPPGYPRP